MAGFLFMDNATGVAGTTCAAYRYLLGSPAQIGNTFGTQAGNSTTGQPRNCLIQFQGDLYAMARDGIYKKDDPSTMTGGWTSQITFTDPEPESVQSRHFGLYAVAVGGSTMNLIGVFGTGPSPETSYRWVKFDGTTWTEASSSIIIGAIDTVLETVIYRGVLHIIGSKSGITRSMTYDPGSNSFSTITNTFIGDARVNGACIFMDRLFCIAKNTSTTVNLSEFTGGTWSVLGSSLSASRSIPHLGKWALFTDGTNMYAMVGLDNTTTYGWKCFQWDTSLVVTEITETVIPAALRHSGAAGGTYSNTAQIRDERMMPVYDTNTTVGTTSIYLYHTANGTSGTPFTVYQWASNAAEFTQQDTGGDVFHAIPSGYPSHGERIWTAGELDIKITSVTPIIGGEQISFIAYGGGTGRNVKIHYSLDSEPILLEATLVRPLSGGPATLNTASNQIEGIAADGVTEYSIVWDFEVDSISEGTILTRVPKIWTVASPTTTWTPEDISNIEAFFISDAGVTLSGSKVTAWENQLTHAVQTLVQNTDAIRPTVISSAINGHPALSFGAGSFMGSVGELPTGQEATFLIVARRTNDSVETNFLSTGTSAAFLPGYSVGSDSSNLTSVIFRVRGASGTNEPDPIILSANTFAGIRASHEGPLSIDDKLYVSTTRAADGSIVPGTIATRVAFYVGSDQGGGGLGYIDVVEISVLAGPISAQDLSDYSLYLLDRYNLVI